MAAGRRPPRRRTGRRCATCGRPHGGMARGCMFPFGKPTRDPLADAKSVGRWLAAFPAGDPLALHGEVLAELGRISERNARRTPARLEAVFEPDALCATRRAGLTRQCCEQ